MERLDTLIKFMGNKLSKNNSNNQTEEEKKIFNSKLLNLELRLIRYYIENRINNDISRVFNLGKFISKLSRINRLGCVAESKIKMIERLMGFYGI